MKWLMLAMLLYASPTFAMVSGVDDTDPTMTDEQQEVFDKAFTTYYEEPSIQKVNTVLDMINTTDLLRKKTAWAPVVGFLTVIFENNKDHVFAWISRNDYTNYAQKVIVSALLHAKLKESASVFAQAQGWSDEDIQQIKNDQDTLDLKNLKVILPSHIDTLWGAYFASGDPVYANEIMDVLFRNYVPYSKEVQAPVLEYDVVGENKKLAESTLKRYAHQHEALRAAIKDRITRETKPENKAILKQLLDPKYT